jgi:hypothetical protein
MRKLVSTFLVGVSLVAGPALAQQHPWLPSGAAEPTGSLPNGDAPVQQHPWVPSGMSTGNLPNGDAPARAESRVRQGGQRHPGDAKTVR